MSEAPTSSFWDAGRSPVQPSLPPSPRYANPFAPPDPRVPSQPRPELAPPVPDAPEEPGQPKRRRFSGRKVMFVVAILTIGVGIGGYPTVAAQLDKTSVPASLHAYVAGRGVKYVAPSLGFAARLPAHPVRRDGPVVKSSRKLRIHRALVSGSGYEIIIRETTLPSTKVLTDGVSGAVYDAVVGGTPDAIHVRRLTFAGRPAFDFDLADTGGPPIHGRVFLAGHRLFVITVQSENAATVLDAMMKSFRFLPSHR